MDTDPPRSPAAGPGQHGPGARDAAAPVHPGPPARARLAASVIVVRDGPAAPEILLVQRNPAARFMGGVWVFPGGAVDAADGRAGDDAAQRAAAVRELAEEAGIRGVDPAGLVRFSRWITPVELAIRFDTHFFVTRLPDGQEPVVDGQECVAAAWYTAQAALDAHADGRILLVLPTIRQLEELRGFGRVDALIDHAGTRRAPTVRPRILVEDGRAAGVVMPGEPGYDPPG